MLAVSSSLPYALVLKNELALWATKAEAESRSLAFPTSTSSSQNPETPSSSTTMPPALIVLLHVHRHFCASSIDFLGLVENTYAELTYEGIKKLTKYMFSQGFLSCQPKTKWRPLILRSFFVDSSRIGAKLLPSAAILSRMMANLVQHFVQ
jgi:hypothetical protein